MSTAYPLTPGSLANDCWPATPQELYNEMFEKGAVTLDITGVIRSASTPGVTDRNKLWVKLDGSNRPVGQFIYYGGLWIWPHEATAGGSERRLWVGQTGTLQTYDGGAVGTVGDASGPMWEEDTDFTDKIPFGAGGTVAVGVDDGAAAVTLETGNMPAHRHFVSNIDYFSSAQPLVTESNQVLRAWDGGGDEEYALMGSSTEATVGRTSATGETTPEEIDVRGPVRGIYLIKRTARVFRVG